MDALYFLIPLSLLVIGAALGVFIWSLRKGQYEDLESPAHRIVFDDQDERAGRSKD